MVNLILLVFLLFFVKHFLADFVLQSQYMAVHKHIYRHPAGWYHAAIHGCATLWVLLLWAHATGADIGVGMTLLPLVETVLHHAIDWGKMNIERRYGLSVDDHAFWVLIGFDQMLHMLTYMAIIWVIWPV